MNPNPRVRGGEVKRGARGTNERSETMDFIFISIKREANSSAAVNGIYDVSCSAPQRDPPDKFEKRSADFCTRLKCIVVWFSSASYLLLYIIINLLDVSHIVLHPVRIRVLPAGMFKWG